MNDAQATVRQRFDPGASGTLMHGEREFNLAFRRRHPVVWWVTLVGPFAATGALVVAFWLAFGAAFVRKLAATWLATTFLLGRFVILGGEDPGIREAQRFFSRGELALMVMWMDLMTACLLVFHSGFLFKLPLAGRRLQRIVEDGQLLLRAHPWMRRATFFGLVAFVMFPVAASGSVGGSIFGRLLGLSRGAAFAAVILGSLLGSGVMYYGAGVLNRYIDRDDPALLISGVAVIIGVIVLLNLRYQRLKKAAQARIGPLAIALAGCALVPASGCIGPQRAATPTERDDVVFYCDGAGGGGPLSDWGSRVKEGLRLDGYEGDFRTFRWQTGLGALADQTTSVSYKRRKARELAGYMKAHWRRFPGGSVHLIGLSAGSAIVVFALEELPQSRQVDYVILLGSSLSADYDLRRALKRVREEVYVFTSRRDRVLDILVPLAGTADRQYAGRRVAGRKGIRMPPDADDATEALYSKVVNVEWDEERAAQGDRGTHTGATNPQFVQRFIAPLLNRDGPRYLRFADRDDE